MTKTFAMLVEGESPVHGRCIVSTDDRSVVAATKAAFKGRLDAVRDFKAEADEIIRRGEAAKARG